uniref:DUF2382 domain-containing protein n=1 Tax=candidate division WOR-3 bacterium TaxID=2052148 RepID=A0A7V3ZZD9_UNCW3
MRLNDITKVVWVSLFLGFAFAQEVPENMEDSTSNYRYREEYRYQEHVRQQGDTIRIMSQERIMNEGDTIQIQNRKRIENPAVESEMTIEKTITKDGDNVVKIEKTVVTPKDTVVIQKEVGSSGKDSVGNSNMQSVRNRDTRCDGEPDTLRVRERERLRVIEGTPSSGNVPGTGASKRRGRGSN